MLLPRYAKRITHIGPVNFRHRRTKLVHTLRTRRRKLRVAHSMRLNTSEEAAFTIYDGNLRIPSARRPLRCIPSADLRKDVRIVSLWMSIGALLYDLKDRKY
jgi:hypothetical protein